MVYKNLLSRFLVSLIFLITYLIVSLYNFQYILYLILLIYLFIYLEVFLYFKKNKIIIYFYLLMSLILLFNINFKDEDYLRFNLLITIIVSFDIFSFIIGKYIGKRKILSYISPKKTFEGLIGGIIFSFLTTLFFCYIFLIEINFYLFVFYIITITSSFFGDIIESLFKRSNNLKNSSNFLPGHGGFFDRFDSLILSLISYSLFNILI